MTDDFDPLASEDFTSAHTLYGEMRKSCPVAHSSEWNGFWALFRYDDVVNVLKDWETYTTTAQNVVPKVAFTGRRPPLHFDPPEHTPYRRALNQFFTPEAIAKLESSVRGIAVELLEPMVDAGGGDVCEDFTRRFPGYVFAEFFHVPVEQSMAIKDVSAVYARALQNFDNERVKETSLELYEVARNIIESRKAAPLDPDQDVTCALLAAKDQNGDPLPDNLILGTIRQMIVVGMIAPSVFIGCMLVHLSEHQALQDQLRGDPSLIPAAIEEYLRLFTPYRGFARTAKRDVQIGGREIKKDEPIALVYASVNRDESVFPNSDEFILNRPNIKSHIAFGMGPHQCAGMPLARMMLRVTLEELLARARITGLTGQIVMTRWPEWGTLAAPVRLERIACPAAQSNGKPV
jgi:cytochrome P450